MTQDVGKEEKGIKGEKTDRINYGERKRVRQERPRESERDRDREGERQTDRDMRER